MAGTPDGKSFWSPYVPSAESPWNLRRVVHLHRRAGFASTWAELQRDLAEGPTASVDRLLAGQSRRVGVPDDFEVVSRSLMNAALAANDVGRLRAWWAYRMLFGPDPLGERLTLLWHNHFATSNVKVNDLRAMCRQNRTFRELARAPFGDLLCAALHDPALLVWLDAHVNRKEHPNENLARELMELFSLGIGHYTERDVKEAARALTGWTVVETEFRENLDWHDSGEKVILGRRGRWKGNDLLRFLMEQPTSAERLAGRIYGMFFGDVPVNVPAMRALAAGLRERKLNTAWALRTILHSQLFFAEANLSNRVAAPVDYVIGSVRALELFGDSPNTLALGEWIARLGQELFCPPNVFGWPGGRAWITTRSVLVRIDFGATLVRGGLTRSGGLFDPITLSRRHGAGTSGEDAIRFCTQLLFGAPPNGGLQETLIDSIKRKSDLRALDQAVVAMLTSPAAQLI